MIMVDMDGACTCLCVYHLRDEIERQVSQKDVYHIMEPTRKTVGVTLSDGSRAEYDCIQVDHPKQLLRDGQALTSSVIHAGMASTVFE